MEKVTQEAATIFLNETDWEIDTLLLAWRAQRIHIDVISNVGTKRSKEYSGADAINKMVALNKANLTTKSLHKRIMEFLKADGVISGIITGTPD